MLTTTTPVGSNRQRALIALVQVLGLCVWFSATAVVPTLRTEWNIGESAAVWLTASVQIGFVVGAITSTVLNLADRIAPQRLLAASALAAGACTAILAWQVSGLAAAIPLRFLTGFFLAGIYPVGMKLMASWSDSSNRGKSFGVLLGALTLGSALPHLIGSFGPLPWRAVMGVASGLTLIAAAIAITSIAAGPSLDTRPITPNPRYALAMFRERGPRLANLGYLGHMWELYALWTWISLFVLSGREQRGDSTGATGLIAFGAIGIAGVIGCLVGGWASDRFGRSFAAVIALAISGSCCLLSPFFFTATTPVLVVFLFVWGASVIADSGVFSTTLSETADSRFIGTALTAQTAIGFLLTVVTIQFVPVLAAVVGWQFAFWLLAPGPAIGAIAMWALRARTHNTLGAPS
ncbi:MFS transporter [Rhodococcus fascians]|nr:MFS transporter [Rhodococcus fascians]MBY4399017.1 MFS transporter [Rhodococcus fascians]MBY4408555.1 MFS transporter [Rhodococcus fascians]MBY4423594.1 MFS transporter [Rhodococcus fascians]MBY4462882.1 MFS transporter [Rhodococcus fascians]